MDYYEIKDASVFMKKYMADVETIESLIRGLSPEVLLFTPDIPKAWTIKEHLIHIADTEVNCFLRYKRARLNPGAVIDFGGGDVESSNTLLEYNSADLNAYMKLFRQIRTIISEEVKRLSEVDLESKYILHPDYGRCNIKFILSIYTQHIDKHMELIHRNIALWKSLQR